MNGFTSAMKWTQIEENSTYNESYHLVLPDWSAELFLNSSTAKLSLMLVLSSQIHCY